MEQYEKSSPEIKKQSPSTKSAEIRHIEEQMAKQAQLIKDLQTEVRQLRSRLDRHADHINRQPRG